MRRCTLGSVLLLLAAALLGCEEKSRDRAAPQKEEAGEEAAPEAPAVVFLGDSLTAGRGLPADRAMPALIEERIEEAGLDYRVINAGRSGDTTAGGLSRLSWYLKDDLEVAAMVVGLGSNDAMRGLPLSEIEKNLREIARRVREHDPDIELFLFQMKTFPNMGERYAGAYEAIFPRVAEEEGMTLLPFPLEGVAAEPELNQEDGIHPNEAGTRKMADNVWEALGPHLR